MRFPQSDLAAPSRWAEQKPVWLLIAGALVLAAAIALHLYTINRSDAVVAQTHERWMEIQREADERLILLLQLRRSIGYGGIAEHFRDYVLLGDEWDARQFTGALGSSIGWTNQLRRMGVNTHEMRQLANIEKVIAVYQAAFEKIPAWRAEGLDAAAIFKRARIDDEVATRSFERLEIEWRTRKNDAEAALQAETKASEFMSMLGWISVPLVIAAALIQLLTIVNLLQAQRSTRQTQSRLRAVLDHAPDGILTLDGSGIVRNFNRGAEKIYGWTAREIIGQPFTRLVHGQPPAYLLRWFADWMNDDLRPNHRSDWRTVRGCRRDGETFPVMATLGKISVDGEMVVIAIVRDMTEVLQAETQLVESREEALAASRAKSRFLANMSHELRTPLNAILGFSELLRDNVLGPQTAKSYPQYGELIHKAGSHLLAIVSDVLDYAKIEAGKFTIEKGPCNLGDIARGAATTVAVQSQAKSVAVRLEIDETIGVQDADERALKQILLNLLSNSLKFTQAGGRITVSLQRRHVGGVEGIAFAVADTGRGIPADQIARVLRPFEQAEGNDATKRDPEQGTGLGLSIVKGLAEAHGGLLQLESVVGEGTVATVFLPSAAASSRKRTPIVVPFTLKQKRA
jgi:two-component system cell cycle sensor histidine kinase PleC